MNKKIFAWVILGVVVLVIAYWLASPLWRVTEINENIPLSGSQQIISQANFIPSAHEVKGRASIIENQDTGKKILRFEDFETVNGPDLFIYLSADLQAEDFVNLGEIKATKGNVNYEIPEGTDLTKYNKVLIWCRAFKVLFSYSEM